MHKVMTHTITKLALLLLGVTAGNSAWAQAQVLTVPPGVPYTFSSTVAAGGGGTITYQWFRDGQPIPDATDSSYTVTADLAYGKNVVFIRGAVSSNCPHSMSYANSFVITFCGLLLNDLCWASTSVAQPYTFADKPDMYTEFYQWNRPVAYSAVSPLTPAWNSTADLSATWTNNPCPAGWRLPSLAEFQVLDNAGSTWADAYTRGNEIAGRFYGPNHASCTFVAGGSMSGCVFFPASGFRYEGTGGTTNRGVYGHVWSSTQNNSTRSYFLIFNSTSSTIYEDSKARGYPIRCVR